MADPRITKEEKGERLARDRAVSAFLLLGEKLRSLYSSGSTEPPRDPPPMSRKSADALFGTIESEVIPRLLLAHKESRDAVPKDRPALSAKVHERFLPTLFDPRDAACHEFVEELLASGVSREVIFLDLLTTAARRLGELWEEDLCDFTDVTIGLCRLHDVLRSESPPFVDSAQPRPGSPRILLATARADQHIFGVVMVSEFFRRAGWYVVNEPGATANELSRMLAQEHFDVLGLSAACTSIASEVAEEIETLRAASRNRVLRVLVGGRLFLDEPHRVEEVGADGIADEASEAPAAAARLLAQETGGG